MKRKEFINHMRWLAVLWLVPYHAACIFRPKVFGDFYIAAINGGHKAYEILLILSRPWIMPLLYAIAGVSAYYALKKRSMGEFARERVFRLLIPLALVTITLSPIQSYIGGLNHFTIAPYITALEYLKKFLSATSNSSGYEGGFSFNGFWYVRYLFYMNVVLFPIMAWFQKNGKKMEEYIGKLSLFAIGCMSIFPFEGYWMTKSDYSFREYFAFFALGFFVLSNEELHEKLSKWCWALAGVVSVLTVYNVYMCLHFRNKGVIYWFLYRTLRWLCLMTIFGFFKRYFDKGCKVTDYLTESSYGFYLLHQTTLLVVVQYIVKGVIGIKGHTVHELYFISVIITYAATFLGYEIIHRIPGLRLMLGTKVKTKKKAVPAAAAEEKE